ncbi:MAG TPA: hypothetical protein VHY22_10100 [Chthoniobacteraceae bacterium]|jgi:hypothetical protein|nr:hypothetical protein [Chthoniobacteraceae bacterium]
MKLNAYILAADPAWIEASVLSYYDHVGRIIVSYDASGRGWTGAPIDIVQCLRRLRAIDRDGKMLFRPGHYARINHDPMENDTYQRQEALNEASAGADWVLQLDTDEVVADFPIFKDCLERAERAGREALNFPAIWLYNHLSGRRYLEGCARGWKRAAGYPGPLAVRAGSKLVHARRVETGHYHVDLGSKCSPVAVPNHIQVDRVIAARHAVYHFSFVRSEAWLRSKFASWGHARHRDWQAEVEKWLQAKQRPLRAVLMSQIERGPHRRALKFTKIPAAVEELIALSRPDQPERRAAVAAPDRESIPEVILANPTESIG